MPAQEFGLSPRCRSLHYELAAALSLPCNAALESLPLTCAMPCHALVSQPHAPGPQALYPAPCPAAPLPLPSVALVFIKPEGYGTLCSASQVCRTFAATRNTTLVHQGHAPIAHRTVFRQFSVVLRLAAFSCCTCRGLCRGGACVPRPHPLQALAAHPWRTLFLATPWDTVCHPLRSKTPAGSTAAVHPTC